MERTAIFPGSFDPFTRGHAALVEEALNLFDRVVIGIGNNTSKQGLLTVENRKRLIDDVFRNEERVEARVYTGLTGEFAETMGACAIIRGVRNTTDFEYERTMESTNHRIYPGRHLVIDRARGALVRPQRRGVHARRNRHQQVPMKTAVRPSGREMAYLPPGRHGKIRYGQRNELKYELTIYAL